MSGQHSREPGPLQHATQFRIEELLSPAAFPHAAEHIVLKQTHMSWVVLAGPYAYKIRKPVRFDFVDMSTLERRAALCGEELRLNRRFAPDLYLGVVPITRNGQQLQVGGSGEALEFAVQMHRFDPSQELATQLERKQVDAGDVAAIATRLADAHDRAAIAPQEEPYGSPTLLAAQMRGNFAPLREGLRDTALQTLDRLAAWTQDSLARLEPGIARRKSSGRVRECHGDLHARNIARWHRQWLAFDCLEFDPALRFIDVMSDVAFLHMDLTRYQRGDLAAQFLSHYLEATGDYGGLPLLPLYATYRALVRAKVDVLGAERATGAEHQALLGRMRARLQTAVRFMDAAPPVLVIMHGVTASGKSWLAERLVPALQAIRIRSDLERKRMTGVAPLTHRRLAVGEGPYDDATTGQTYERLLRCADAALEGRCGVVVDAAFLHAAQRAAFRELAAARRCRFLIVSCHADSATLESRLDTRARIGLDPSEATRDVLHAQLRTRETLGAPELQEAVVIDTRRPDAADAGVRAIQARLGIARA